MSWFKDFLKFLKSILLLPVDYLFSYWYPTFVEAFYNTNIDAFKREIFDDIGSTIPLDKRDGQLRILEVGVGPGYNLDFYPAKCRLIALDKNQYFKRDLMKNLQKHPEIIFEKFVHERAENMTSIPSNSIDIVITSNLHCSVDNNESVLKEIRRVLVPGGRYYFSEHVLDEPHTTRYKWQIFFNKTLLWYLQSHGCVFIDFQSKISKSGLFKYKGKRYVIQNTSWSYYPAYLVASHYGGCAIK